MFKFLLKDNHLLFFYFSMNEQESVTLSIQKENLEREIIQKKLKILKEKKGNSKSNEEILITCQKCNHPFIIWRDADYFNCLTCLQQFCVKCNENWLEHKNKICLKNSKIENGINFPNSNIKDRDIDFPTEKNDFQVKKNSYNNDQTEKDFNLRENETVIPLLIENDSEGSPISRENHLSDDEKIKLLMKERKWQNCPECGSIVEKTAFCNFIICKSSLCQRKVIFCYLCGNKLNEQSKKSHFIDDNSYANDCINTLMENINNKNEDFILRENKENVSSFTENKKKKNYILQKIINAFNSCFVCIIKCMKFCPKRNEYI